MFVDQVKIKIQAGNGGDGCSSFRREKYIPRGGPDGGNGGKGGDIIFQTDRNLTTLLDLRYQQLYRAEHGRPGKGRLMTGRSGKDMIIKVPIGTLVKDLDTGDLLTDLCEEFQEYIPAEGGRGGRGNHSFKSSVNRAPRRADPGILGEKKTLFVELKLLADVAIIGFPNAGKSTLISKISNSRPKIADYPFTTLIPNLGVVKAGDFRSFVAADIPGLIEGAHLGKGLGVRFLKHTERSRLLVHLIDFSLENERDPEADFRAIQNELKCFSEDLFQKPQLLVASKVDHPEAEKKFEDCKARLKELNPTVLAISSITGKGLKDLINHIEKALWGPAEEAPWGPSEEL